MLKHMDGSNMQHNYKIVYSQELKHHGIKGQKWGKKNGPPYPLDDNDHSASERKAGWKSSLKSKLKLTDKQKKYLKIGAAVAVAGLAVYGAYKYSPSISKIYNNLNIFSKDTRFREALAYRVTDTIASTSKKIMDSQELKNRIQDGRVSDYIQKNWDDLPTNEKYAVQGYTTSLYHQVNGLLRGKTEEELMQQFGPDIKKALINAKFIDKDLKTCIDKCKIDNDITLFRGTPQDVISSYFPNVDWKNPDVSKLIGKEFTEKGYTSTSISPNPTKSFGKMKWTILAPKGTKGVYANSVSEASYEKEMILQKSSKFLIQDAKVEEGILSIVVSVVDQLS